MIRLSSLIRFTGALFASAAFAGAHSKKIKFVIALPLFVGPAVAQFWPQWALNSQHTGQISVAGQALNNILSSVTYDPLVPAEMASTRGELLAHR